MILIFICLGIGFILIFLCLLNITHQLILLAQALKLSDSEKYRIELKTISYKGIIFLFGGLVFICSIIYFLLHQNESNGYLLTLIGTSVPFISGIIVAFSKHPWLDKRIAYSISIKRTSPSLWVPYIEKQKEILNRLENSVKGSNTDLIWDEIEKSLMQEINEFAKDSSRNSVQMVVILKLVMCAKDENRKKNTVKEFIHKVSQMNTEQDLPFSKAQILKSLISERIPISYDVKVSGRKITSDVINIFESLYKAIDPSNYEIINDSVDNQKKLFDLKNLVENQKKLFDLYSECVENLVTEKKYQCVVQPQLIEQMIEQIVSGTNDQKGLFMLLNALCQVSFDNLPEDFRKYYKNHLVKPVCEKLCDLFSSVDDFLPRSPMNPHLTPNSYSYITSGIVQIELMFFPDKNADNEYITMLNSLRDKIKTLPQK
ncbi:MAG: hypothetical protein WBV73_21110 [Phormidium sp.]